MCMNCFSRFRPRYKRLVDNIFPLSPEEGLVKTNMEKLTFYALSSPEKLDRIGEYLYQRASRDISRRRNGYVVIAMEAMDQLLAACHSQTLNLFVESFLKIVQKLLESLDPDLQILATNSFVRFANIEEDTPSYHRRYDFFVSKFSALCHSNYADVTKRNKLRLAGIRGIQGVIRKTVSDDLVENIWESTHMEKIIPSLLFNMQESGHYQSPADPEPEAEETGKMMNLQEDPPALAETCLRELMSRASFNHVKNVIQPVLIHFDHHALWNPNIFATHVLRMLMYSVQSQYSHLIVNCILAYLNDHHSSPSLIRAKIADALSKIISIAASESIGPTVLEVLYTTLTLLCIELISDDTVVDFIRVIMRIQEIALTSTTLSDSQKYNLHALVAALFTLVPLVSPITNIRDYVNKTIAARQEHKTYHLLPELREFAANLPDYQKTEILVFIISKVLSTTYRESNKSEHTLVQNMFMKSLLMVSGKYTCLHISSAFPLAFLEPLLKILQSNDAEIRLLVNKGC
ncbi:protein EFR3 homolog B [Diaphorina citri]|uniref:Protein EFR3 homolog B n=1 Tax=Diaphorina citri TaxID=121845 RepID=A0A3Q0J4Z9_DIACI|nr:protein EFR3 homolog B [Diaphorina citri]